jgi:hypothetical protein
VAKTALRPIVGIFEYAEFLVSVTSGPSPATGVVGPTSCRGSPRRRALQGGYVPATGAWTVGSLAASQTATLQRPSQRRAPS